MSPKVAKALAYFQPNVTERLPPAAEEMIVAAEHHLGVSFPSSMRTFLKVHNGLRLPDELVVLGAPPAGEPGSLDVVEASLRHRDLWGHQNIITITCDGTGDDWVLLPDLADERGEYPVAGIDPETGELDPYAASSYERFLWFQLDLLKRFFKPDGTKKRAYYQYIASWPEELDEAPDWLHEEPDLPWPYDDLSWILRHDPRLARLRPDE